MLGKPGVPQAVGGFLAWWRGELAALWPGRASSADSDAAIWELSPLDGQLSLRTGSDGARYLIDPDDDEAELPAGLKVPATPVVLQLDPAFAMVAPVELPLAAEENLDRVLSYQMDHETPFTADQVFFDHRVTVRDRGAQKLIAELVVIPRRVLEPLFEHLRSWGVPLKAATLRIDGDSHSYNLLPDAWRATPRRWPLLLNGALAAAALVLLAAGVALPLFAKQQTLDALEPQVKEARDAALATRQLREETEQLRARLDFARNEKRDRVKLLDVLGELTSLLPDDTWLLQLEVRGDEVQLRGETPNAAQLVGLLEASERLRNARFRSPVVQIAAAGRERFHLSVDLQQQQEEDDQ